MICALCGGEVAWRGPHGALTHSECERCGGGDCQRFHEQDEDADPAEPEDPCWECGGEVDQEGKLCRECDPPETARMAQDIERAATARVCEFTSPGRRHWYTAHPSATERGRTQLTCYDEAGPVGHTTWDDMRQAAGSAMGRTVGREPPVGDRTYRLTEVLAPPAGWLHPDQRALMEGLASGERAGFRFKAPPGPEWDFNRCGADGADDDESGCVGCEGWGYECWSVWKNV